MEELIIGEKKYVSSKRAAKITGYAKDYIGQLCREGRVPARLVGRSWYVLESAIQDHRFGAKEEEPKEVQAKKEAARPTDAWEAPRYEAAEPAVLPVVNRLREEEEVAADAPSDTVEHLQNAWQAWFDRVADAATGESEEPEAVPVLEADSEALSEPEIEASEAVETEDVAIPIRAIYAPPLLKPVRREVSETTLPAAELEEAVIIEERPRRKVRRTGAVIRVGGIALAMISVFVAVLGTGFLDGYILSNSQARAVAGVTLYNK